MPRAIRARGLGVLMALLLCSPVLPPASPAMSAEPYREHGYIDLPDGERLKYTVLLPSEDGSYPDGRAFPVIVQYEGYNAGSFPTRGNPAFPDEMLRRGYGFMGVSVRGSACSGGTFDMFDPQWALDGAYAVEWAARRPWSNGRLGMYSLSFAGIMQLWVAAMQPPSLVAIAPGQVITDLYRDVADPGGVPNGSFPTGWMALLHATWAEPAPRAIQDGDTECLGNIATHPLLNLPAGADTIRSMEADRYDDAYMQERSVRRLVDRIDVPVLAMQSWQDEQTGSRAGYYIDILDPEQTWLVSTNGHHLMYMQSPRWRETLVEFFDRFLGEVDNGFDRTPRVQVWHETRTSTRDPSAVTTYERWPPPVEPLALHLSADGGMSEDPAGALASSTSFLTGLPAPWVVPPETLIRGAEPISRTWETSTPAPGGSLAFTSATLPDAVTTYGEASADLWVSSTSPSADVQVTLTEVRPDGNEVYVQRGWLRLSHRALDPDRSTPLRPYHPHTKEAEAPMPLGEPQLARVEILPSGHTFRPGSRIRLWVESPSPTGLWFFSPDQVPSVLSVHHGADHPSRMVLGTLPGADLPPDPPDCGELLLQPCRPDPIA